MKDILPPVTKLDVRPLTPKRWADFEKLFGKRGACGGCWCMWWRMKAADFENKKGPANKRAMKRIVESGKVPGLIGYVNKEPVAWCSLGAREIFSRLGRSRILKPVDDKPVWSIVCFFITRPFRRRGVSRLLLDAAIAHATKRGATLLEGYPVDTQETYADAFAYTGLASPFVKIGFKEIARRSPKRPILRCEL